MPARTLRAAVRSSVSADVRARCESYFQQKRVSILNATDGCLVASVKGSRKYQVTLDLREEELTVSCTCPYFTDVSSPCKHVWATILAADEARAFNVPPTVYLTVPEDSEDELVDDLDPDDPDESGDLSEELWNDEPAAYRPRRAMTAAQRAGQGGHTLQDTQRLARNARLVTVGTAVGRDPIDAAIESG
jgi:uncharacterized Zn finger protein